MYCFIVNPHCRSGKGKRVWEAVERILKRESVLYESYQTEKKGDARRFAQMLTQCCQEPRVIVAVGGDGTMNEVLDGLNFSPMITVGYIPAGSGNDLARSLGFSGRPGKCLRRILASRQYKLLDYGVLTMGRQGEHRRFAVSAGIGMDAEVCQEAGNRGKRRLFDHLKQSRLVYGLMGIKLLKKTKGMRGYVVLDGVKKIEFNYIYFMSAHIHPFEGGGFRLAPCADGSDGMLNVCVVSHASRIRLFKTLALAFLSRKKRGKGKGIRTYECREAVFHLENPALVHADGEVCGEWNEIQVECIGRQIRMIV
ncbi:MAG TPA: diacylglycerol kinase family lipid kinase [Candidatus Cottocaccamicrobium excrementipullorum]|nr:diacylglycerol kinase family lipid kinase [Candidatus Cottocaccamicrobium excrementipullorum]